MGYRSEDGSPPRAGSGRPSDWSAGIEGADDFDSHATRGGAWHTPPRHEASGPPQYAGQQYAGQQYAGPQHAGPQHAGQQYSDEWYADAGHDTDWRAGSRSRSGPADEWYPEEPGNLTDPYGVQAGGAVRDPVRGYPPAPEFYQGEDYQRFDQPGYDRQGYDGPGYDRQGYDNDPADQEPYSEEDDPFPDDPYNGRRPRQRRRTRRRRGFRTALLSVAAGVIVIAVGAAAYVFFLGKPNSAAAIAPAQNPTARAQAPTGPTSSAAAACAARLGTYCHIETRTLDPLPLSLAEVFRAQFLNISDGSSFAEAGGRIDTNCASAIIGNALQSAVKAGKCTQVLRASYVSGNGEIMGTIGVVNLDTTQDAAKAGAAVDANDFINPLTTKTGVTSKLGNGTGVVQAEYKGHYLILTWAEFTNLKTPDTHQSHLLEQFETDLVAGTINISLSERMVTGKPATAASGA